MMHRIQRVADAALHLAARVRKNRLTSRWRTGDARLYRWGLLGCGNIAASFARGLVYLPDGTLEAAASLRPGASEQFIARHDGKKAYTRYEDLLADPAIDLVYIATPHHLHHELARKCLEAGKHVLCEKPFTLNAAEAEDLVRLAAEKQRFLMEAMWTRFLPATRAAVARIREGVIGDVRRITANFGFYADVGPSHRLLNRNLAGGSLLDIGVYPLSFANMIFRQEPTQVTGTARIGATGVDTHCEGVLEYPGGASAHWSASFESNLPGDATIEGTLGSIRLPTFWMAKEFVLKTKGASEIIHRFPYRSTGLQFEAREVMDCLNRGLRESPLMPLADTLSVLRQMDRLRTYWGLTYPGEAGQPSA